MSTDVDNTATAPAYEPVTQYDRDHLAEYQAAKRAEALLDKVGVDGMRQPTKAEIANAEEKVKEYKKAQAQSFIDKYKEITEYHGIEIDLDGFEQVAPRTYVPKLGLKPWKKPEPPQTRKWSEAMKENLNLRLDCEHKEHEHHDLCEKCGLDKRDWGTEGKGATKEYEQRTRDRIEKEKEKEATESEKPEETPEQEKEGSVTVRPKTLVAGIATKQ